MGRKKGKAQNGRAKQKGKAQKGCPHTHITPQSRDRRLQQIMGSDWEEDTPIQFRGFAQSGPSQGRKIQTPQSGLAKLSRLPISFVSAGVNTPTPPQTRSENATADMKDDGYDHKPVEESDEESLEDDSDVDDSLIQTNILDADIEIPHRGVANLNIHEKKMNGLMKADAANQNARPDARAALPFVIDTLGDNSLAGAVNRSAPKMPTSAPSPSSSDSSDEVVVFSGRSSKAMVVHDPVTTKSAAPVAVGREPRPNYMTDLTNGSEWTPGPDPPSWTNRKGRARPDLGPSAAEKRAFKGAVSQPPTVQFAETSEYQVTRPQESLEALKTDWKNTLRDKKKAKKTGSSVDSATTPNTSRRSKRGRKRDNRAMREPIVSDGDDSEAAYDDYMENLKSQLDDGDNDVVSLLQVSAIGGPSLVVDGEEVDDDEVLPAHKKIDWSTIKMDDSSDSDDSAPNPDFDELSSVAGESDLEDELDYNEREQWADEEDLRRRRMERMTDEKIARLFAKQEELGIDGDELVIEDGGYISSDLQYGDVQAARSGLADMASSAFARTAGRGMRRGDHSSHFPNASTLADAVEQYGGDGFDIMDFDRPSLRPTKKGRKGTLPPEVENISDEELKEELRSQWEKDRGKKRQKKQEREELRTAGLLGSSGRKGIADLSVKYSMGMDMQAVHNELRDFLLNENLRQRSFPPMDKENRKALHEICVALKLKSQSQGVGKSRFPVVYKTARTVEYSDSMFYRIIQASSRGFLNSSRPKKMKFGNKAGGGSSRGPGGGRGGGMQAASVRHGEVVGAGAAEISQNSMGHKLMEKMGWTKGMALGKDGEGLLNPVEQRMRVGTAGLG